MTRKRRGEPRPQPTSIVADVVARTITQIEGESHEVAFEGPCPFCGRKLTIGKMGRAFYSAHNEPSCVTVTRLEDPLDLLEVVVDAQAGGPRH